MKKTFLGIDPGSIRTGWAVLQYYHRHGELLKITILDSGSIVVPKNYPRARRVNAIQQGIYNVLCENLNIEEVFMEDAFVKINARTAMALSQVHGVIMSSTWKSLETSPIVIPVALVRKILHIPPKATKEEVKNHLATRYQFTYGNEKAGHFDQSDASAVALAGHVGRRGFMLDNDGKIIRWKDPNKSLKAVYIPSEESGLYPGLEFSITEQITGASNERTRANKASTTEDESDS